MKNVATFRFHGNLNDFLSKEKKETTFEYPFNQTPAVKDTIEAIGIPHTEVGELTINGQPASFSQKLSPGDIINVFPFAHGERPIPAGDVKFICDVHLGRLARYLRMAGFDTYYENHLPEKTILALALHEERVLLTRDRGLLKNKGLQYAYFVRNNAPSDQFFEVVKCFDLCDNFQPFSRCINCNGNIVAIEKERVIEQLPPLTKIYFNDFYQCTACHKVYWTRVALRQDIAAHQQHKKAWSTVTRLLQASSIYKNVD